MNQIPLPAGMPVLRTARLEVRPLHHGDLAVCHRLYNDIGWSDPTLSDPENLALRRSWLTWSVANERELARLHQPPLGDRAVVDAASGEFIGLVGLVPALAPFGLLPSFGGDPQARQSLEMGLFWAVSPGRQRTGVATEAALGLIDHAFGALRLARIVATTEHDNHASIGVMRRLGMTLERNPLPEPAHFQTVGRLDAEARS